MYKNFIFDLDGTLLETLPDIVTAINAALKECGFDYVYDIESGKKIIGDGVANLMHRALKDKDTPENFEAIKGVFMPLYQEYQTKTTKAMKGCVETLFVGDSLTDYNTARNGGLAFCLCVYGYGNYTSEFIAKSDYNIKEPKELLNLTK